MIAAFIIGLIGSLHCVGMCGPLNLLMISKSRSYTTFALYHFGRICAYAMLGLILGAIGYSIYFFEFQQIATFALGASLILLYGIPKVRVALERFYFQSRFYRLIQAQLAKNLSSHKRWLMGGVANGFLPCGLTYVAAAGAVAGGGLGEGILYMLFFGLGTLPAMILLSVGMLSSGFLRRWIPQSVPVIAVLSGGLLMLRGFLISSPNFNQLVQAKAAGLITVCGL